MRAIFKLKFKTSRPSSCDGHRAEERAFGEGDGGRRGGLDDLIRFREAGRYSGRARRDDERGALISVTEREELAAVIAPLTALISI